jgi:hypothetical protein
MQENQDYGLGIATILKMSINRNFGYVHFQNEIGDVGEESLTGQIGMAQRYWSIEVDNSLAI